MAAYAYSAINVQGLEVTGEIHATDTAAAREQLRSRGLLPQTLTEQAARRRGRFRGQVQEGQAEVAADLCAADRDDDRGGSQRRPGARDPRGADGRRVPRGGHRRASLGRRGRDGALRGVRSASQGVQPAVHRDDRGRRVVRHARPGPRPRGDADREGDADQAARQGRDGLSDRRPDLRHARPHLHAALHRPGLRRRLRRSRRRAPGSDEGRGGRLEFPAGLLVHHLPGLVRGRLRAAAFEAHRARSAAMGCLQARASR